jgi:hypothetical protein
MDAFRVGKQGTGYYVESVLRVVCDAWLGRELGAREIVMQEDKPVKVSDESTVNLN